MTGRSLNEITDLMRRRTRAAMRLAAASVFGLAVIVAGVLVSGTETAKADSIYIGSGGIGFSFGTGGYRGGAYYGGRGYYGDRGYYGGGYYRPHRPYYRPYYKRPYRYRSRVRINPPLYIAPPPVVVYPGAPQRVPYTKTGLAPFTPEYYAYCARKFKSFNPNTGTYLAYSGKHRFCR